MKTILAIILIVLYPAISSCSSRIDIPMAPPIDRITVTHNFDTLSTITDSKEIDAILSFLRAHDNGWHGSFDTFPTPQYDVKFESSGSFRYVMWISAPGANWIGFRADGKTAGDNVLREISSKEWSDLIGLLHVAATANITAPATTTK